jgi:mannose-1-phosphate guanylyltransferase
MPPDSQNQDFKKHLYALVLAGGGGTRLWPKSREATPKQFLSLFKGKTLTQMTLSRLSEILPWERIWVATVSEGYKKEILKEVPEVFPENIIVEPARRDTGPAHGLGALFIFQKDPDAVIMTESADRLVDPIPLYLKTLLAAAKVAYENKVMVAMGVTPTYAHTGLGYLKKGVGWGKVEEIDFFRLEQFVEKPSQEVADQYVSSGNYLWNAGQFVWRADTLLASLKVNAPEISQNLDKIVPAIGMGNERESLKEVYEKMPKISIDYAVAEKDKNFLAVLGTFRWIDIGDWKEVWENLPKDKDNNVIIDGKVPGGRVINIDVNNSLIHTDGRLISVVDVDDVAIVDTKDVLLVCKKSRAQSVKKIVEQLKEEGKSQLL